jgi:hypothetical protein
VSAQERLLKTLDAAKRAFVTPQAKVAAALSQLARLKIDNADDLIRLHETLLFMRAYPRGPRLLKQTEKLLKRTEALVENLRKTDADISALDDAELSGIAGGSVTSNFSYSIVCWLVAKYPAQLSIDWDWFEEEDRFGAIMQRFLPLMADDAMVEAHVPFREWLYAGKGRERELTWLIRRFQALPVPEKEKANLYDSLKLHITWRYGLRSSRTAMRLAAGKPFFHDAPLIARRDVSLSRELSSSAVRVRILSRPEGEKILDIARETSAVRYRELHGFTYGDARRVIKAEFGRGTVVYVVGVSPANRLPLRAYHAAMMFKNGVPVGYFEGLSICERMESGFNLYYTFRDGETAWLYARILHLMRQLLGVSVFSIDPYQVGHENEEGIESGAFWFYRKLGFRPVKSELMKLTDREEKKVAVSPGYRTSASTLRRLAAGHMLFELSPSKSRGMWDKFEVRNVGLAVLEISRRHSGDSDAMRGQAAGKVARALGVNPRDWNTAEAGALNDLALVLALEPRLENWTVEQKQLAVRIIRAKAGHAESVYLRLMQKHAAFRDVLIRLGSRRGQA